MRLGGTAAYMAEVRDRGELVKALTWAERQDLPVIMIGDGSNIYWRDEGFPGLVLVNNVLRFDDAAQSDGSHLVTIGAGENWDSAVARIVQANLTGIEALSLIPGTAGATPVQNVGAYGQEIAQTLVSVEAYDRQEKRFVDIPASDCGFGYRTSRFKTTEKGRFFIMSLTLRLHAGNPQPPFYAALQTYLTEKNIQVFTPQVVRDAVIVIRSSKLPDPELVANNGSFFANPIISDEHFRQILAAHADAPHWPAGEGRVKVPAAWLLEQAGFKNYHDPETGMATWPTQPLVLVNEHAGTTANLLKFKQKIVDAVQQKFGITLQQEPELLP